MKKVLFLTLILCGGPLLVPGVEAAPTRTAVKLQWPTFRQVASKKSVPDVTAIQYLLRSRGFYGGKPDGVFGAQTAASVRAFQRKNGLKADGIVAARTFSRLVPTLRRGDKGDAVRALQTILKYDFTESETLVMPPLQVSGNFGPQTERALQYFQKYYSLKVSDAVGVRTWAFLFDGDTNSGFYQ